MRYRISYDDKVLKQLRKMEKKTSQKIISWIETNLEGSESPREKGKALTGPMTGIWRYRVGDFRLLARIKDDELIILVIEIRNRKNVYD